MAVADTVKVLVIRAWHEGGGFRARITSTLDIEKSGEEVILVSSEEAVEEEVRRWLGLGA
jgi:hypothetical protein